MNDLDEQTKRVYYIVTGGNGGIGREIVKSLVLGHPDRCVLLTSRILKDGELAKNHIEDELLDEDNSLSHGSIRVIQLDVSKDSDFSSLDSTLHSLSGPIVGLVNNSGVLLDASVSAQSVSSDVLQQSFEVNSIGPVRMMQLVLPFMKKQRFGRIVNVSSLTGTLKSTFEENGHHLAYRMSKMALNIATTTFTRELLLEDAGDIIINACCPGLCDTKMTSSFSRNLPFNHPATGADKVVALLSLPKNSISGVLFSNYQPISM